MSEEETSSDEMSNSTGTSVLKAYLETSAVNRTEAMEMTGATIADVLRDQGLESAIGMHTIYELARGFITPEQGEKSAHLFSIIQDLAPSYVPMTWTLLEQEILKLRTGTAVLPFLGHLDYASTALEVREMARGKFSAKAEKFVRDREDRVTTGSVAQSRMYLQHIQAVRLSTTDSTPNFRTVEQVWDHFQPDIPQLIRDVLHGRISDAEARELHARLNEFPALRSAVRANVYYSAIHIIHQTTPAKDKLDDPRHVIDASYCSVFVSEDSQLKKRVSFINPDLKVRALDELVRSADSTRSFSP